MKTNAFSFFNSDVATRFETNFREQRLNSSASILEFLYRRGSDPSMITCAFAWGDTPEGIGYWKTINILWKEFLEGKRMSLPEDLDVEEVGLQKRLEAKLQEVKPTPATVMEEFRSLFGEQVLKLFRQNWEKFSRQYGEGQSLEEYLQKQIECSTVDRMVAGWFTFYFSPEGDKYWRKIDGIWKQYWAARSVMRVK